MSRITLKITDKNGSAPANIKNLITEKNLKQSEVARSAGLTIQELSDMITGRRLIYVCDILRLADALGVTADEICR